jgi:hypothetical protein
MLDESDDPQQKTLGEILSALEALRGSVEDVKQLVSPPKDFGMRFSDSLLRRPAGSGSRIVSGAFEQADALHSTATVEEAVDSAKDTKGKKAPD